MILEAFYKGKKILSQNSVVENIRSENICEELIKYVVCCLKIN